MELRTLVTSSITPLSGDAIIEVLKSNGFPNATTSPMHWKTGPVNCSISYDPASRYITLSDTTDDATGGRAIVINAHDDVVSNALEMVIKTVKSEVSASEISGY